MAITVPRTDVLSVGFSDQKFSLMERQELSRQTNGVTRGKSMGSALWVAEWVTIKLTIDDGLDYEAILNSLDGVINTFYAGDLRRPFPRADPQGAKLAGGPSLFLDFTQDYGYIAGLDAVKIASLGSNGKSLSLKGLPPDYVLSRGDYLSFDYGAENSRALHQVMETVTSDAEGVTTEFDVRPHLRAGAALDAPVALKNPSALFALQPGSVTSSLINADRVVVSFRAIQMV